MIKFENLTNQEIFDLTEFEVLSDVFKKEHQKVMNIAFWDAKGAQNEELKKLVYSHLPLTWSERLEQAKVNPYNLLKVYRLFWMLGEDEKLDLLYSDIEKWCFMNGFDV